MKKSELLAVLASINDDELVLFKEGDRMFSVISAEIQQEEAPIYAIVTVVDLSVGDFKQIADDRVAAKEAAAERQRQAEEAEAEESARQEAALEAIIDQRVAAKLAERGARNG